MAGIKKIIFAFIFWACCMVCPGYAKAVAKIYNILQYGAKSGLSTMNTKAIQQAINQAAITGGIVLVPAGNFITGPIVLKNGVELHLDDDAVLLGSTSYADYKQHMTIIFAKGQNNIAITGKGTIDGRGAELVQNLLEQLRSGVVTDEQWLAKRPMEQNRPGIILFTDCKNVRVNGVAIKNAACWVQTYKQCTDVNIDNIKVQSTVYWNNDGIDIVDSKNVRITNSYFNSADDAICLKSESVTGICENVVIDNCIARSSANAFKIGTGSLGSFKNITVNNLTVFDTYRSAIAIETVDGAGLEHIIVTRVRAKNTGNAVFIRLGHRNTDNRYSTVNDVLIDDIIVEVPAGKPDIGYPLEGPLPKIPPHNLIPSSITGIPGHPVQNVILKNVQIIYGGGGTKSRAYVSTDSLSTITNNITGYPEFSMFGELPAWGMYIRYAEGITLNNVNLSYQQADYRPAIVADEVKDLKLNGLHIPASEEKHVIVLNRVSNPVFTNLQIPGNANQAVVHQNK
jgi:hypothetical protein